MSNKAKRSSSVICFLYMIYWKLKQNPETEKPLKRVHGVKGNVRQHSGKTFVVNADVMCAYIRRCKARVIHRRLLPEREYHTQVRIMNTYTVALLCHVCAAVLLNVVTAAPATDMFVEKVQKILSEQSKELETLGCKPVPQRVTVVEQLEYHDDLADKIFFPQVVVLKRCLKECGFCGNTYLGTEKGRCVPDPNGIRERSLMTFHYDPKTGKKIYQEVLAEEHLSCICE